MKRARLIFFFCFISIITFAQQSYRDVIYLKNAGIIKGVIIEQNPFKNLKIYTTAGDTLEYQISEIEKIVREPVIMESKSETHKHGLKAGHEDIIEIGISTALPPNDYTACYKLNIIKGYKFNRNLFLGLGIGLRYAYLIDREFFNSAQISPVFNNLGLPLFCDFRVNFPTPRIDLFLALAVGFSFDLGNHNPNSGNSFDSSGNMKVVGLMLSPTAGARFRISDKHTINIGISYEFQQCAADSEYNSSRCLSINLGYSF
jgi:hypothetical protein